MVAAAKVGNVLSRSFRNVPSCCCPLQSHPLQRGGEKPQCIQRTCHV